MNNGNPLLGQVLGGLFGQAMQRRGMGGATAGGTGGGGLGAGLGGLGGGLGAGLGAAAIGSVLGGMLRGHGQGQGVPVPGGGHPYANRTTLLVMLLPLAMRWIQSNGGIGAVLDRVRQRGLGEQAKSWVGTGANQPVDGQAVEQVVGSDDLRQMAQRLGVPEHEVAQAFAEILPEMVDKLSPQGQVPPHADAVLDEGRQELEKQIQDVPYRDVSTS